ncbi:hypothetical protein Dxin01_01195 [Deinococcus xinjiangensis]|uniref:Lipoprotein n=1 Tax=Deinococcus xinjiangensis TaxID=457454 RepID=A0ABP9V853_9DEIO
MRPRFALLLALPLLGACTTLRPNTLLTLERGQTGGLGSQSITLVNVQDSRCRPNVQCVWAGELVAQVRVTEGRSARTLFLRLPEARNTPWQGLRILRATFDPSPKVTFTNQR